MGNEEKALTEPNSVILTESMARKYFGQTNVLGQQLTIGRDRQMMRRAYQSTFTVTGIAADPPKNSHIQLSLIHI